MAEERKVAENGQPWYPVSPNGKAEQPKIQSTLSSFFKPKAPNYALAPRLSPERNEDWVSLSPPKVEDMDGAHVVALDDIEGPTSPTEQIQRETNMTTGRDPKALDIRASIIPIEPSHVTSIKRINGLLLCISYPPWFYQQLSPPTAYGSYSRAIMWTDKPGATPIVIGSLITRRDPVTEFKRSGEREGVKADDTALYIAALTLLSPYRSKGLAQAALESVIRQIVSTPAGQEAGGIKSLYAHVWTENTEGLDWYAKMGFHKEGKPVEGYYSRLTPATAWVLRRHIGVSEHLMRTKDALSASCTFSDSTESDSAGLDQNRDVVESTILKRPASRPKVATARSFMSKGPENEWNDLPQEMVVPRSRSGTTSAARTPGTSAPPSAVPSRTPSVAPPLDGRLMAPPVGEGSGVGAGARKKKKSRAYAPAALNGDLVNGSLSRDGSMM